MTPTRRSILQAGALATSGALVGLSGCTGGGNQSTPPPTESPSPTPTAAGATVAVAEHGTFGEILVDGAGRTLYLLTADPPNESVCSGGCAEAWPPLTVEAEADLHAGPDVAAELGSIERDDGSLQVTADGVPLYYFVRDEGPGDARGQEVNNVWFVLRPDASAIKPTVSVREVDPHGALMTDADGLTLYIFTPDPDGQSVCTGGCAEAWPPLTVQDGGALVESVRADPSLGTTERDDGSRQVTADGMPLYYFVRDEERGDALGQEVNNVWFLLRPDASVLKPTVSVREHPDLGPILTDADGMTLYLFTNDEGTTTTCTGGCADAWPPHTVAEPDALVDSVLTDVPLGTTEHPEAGPMVTAAGHPLYYYAQDEAPGDATGQGVGDVWYVLDPEGNQVGGTATTTESDGGLY